MTDGELFSAVGEALYGEEWKGKVAALLEVRKATVSEWARGAGAPIPADVWVEVSVQLRGRQISIDQLIPTLLAKIEEAKKRPASKKPAPDAH